MDSCSPIKYHYDQSSGFQTNVGAGDMSVQASAHNHLPNYSPLLPTSASKSQPLLEFNYNMSPFACVSNQPKHTTFSANGEVHNLPQSMLQDQYGLAGLMVGRQLAAKGMAPYANGLQISAQLLDKQDDLYEPLLERFGGPFNMTDLEPDRQEKVFNPDYLVSSRMISENKVAGIDQLRKLWALRLDNCKEDLLFFLFYSFPKDSIQLIAANHLFTKGWRYHMEFKVWMHRMNNDFVSDGTREKGVYIYFDHRNWKLLRAELVLDLSKLEGPPNKPPEPGQMQPQCFSRETA